MQNIIYATIAISAMGLIFGGLLGIASKIFNIEQDEKLPLIIDALPGANCGGCGYAGCAQFANAVLEGSAKPNACPVGGEQTAKNISSILGVSAEKFEKKAAFVLCAGSNEVSETKFQYQGEQDCFSASKMLGGQKACNFGCLGFGSCMDVCKYGAIEIKDNLAVINIDKCTACGLCVNICPKKVIKIISKSDKYIVKCQNQEKGNIVKEHCKAGCIGCRICEKNCSTKAVNVNNFLATIDKGLCIGCGVCAEKCPKKIIKKVTI
jgi:RnfABCDGE-type electron transport complex B subunit